MRAALRSFRILLLTSLAIASGLPSGAQVVDDGFNPNVLGTVRCSAVMPDGKLWIGGSFDRVGTTAVSNLARIRWDGAVNMTETRPNPNGTVRCLLPLPDGKLLVGGDFTEIGGEERLRLVRLLADGEPDPEFILEIDGEVRCLLADGGMANDGSMLVGGAFTRVNGSPRAGLARIFANGSLDRDFNPALEAHANVSVNALIRQPDGKILLGGQFESVGGRAAGNLARLHPSGTPDSGFNGSTDGEVHAVGVQADGKVVIGGDFAMASGIAAEKIARLNPDGSFQKTLAGFKDRISAITILTDGKIIAAGRFPALSGLRYGKLARLLADMTFDKTYEPYADGEVFSCMLQSDGHLLVGGSFIRIDLTTRRGLARLDGSGRTEIALIPAHEGSSLVTTVVQQPDEKLLVAGGFTFYGGAARNGLARTNSNGVLDTSFVSSVPLAGVVGLQVRRDQKLLVLGTVTVVNQVSRPGIARLQADGKFDSSFNANLKGASPISVDAIADESNGRLYLGGRFSLINEAPRNMLGRVAEATGAPDSTTFSTLIGPPNDMTTSTEGGFMISGNVPTVGEGGVTTWNQPYLKMFKSSGGSSSIADLSTNGKVNGVCRLPEGKFLVWGSNLLQGQNIIRRLASGGADTTFKLTTNGEVRSVNLQADGSMIVIGSFTTINGQLTGFSGLHGVARVLANGKPDTTYRPLFNFPGLVRSAMIQKDGKLVLWGDFTSVNSSQRRGLARLPATMPATQELGVADGGSNLVWQRSGSAPEVERVWFSTSTNGTAYTTMKEARWVHGRWESGSELPARTPLWIRAEGRVASSNGGEAGGLVESVRQVFLDGEVEVEAEGLARISGEGQPLDFGKTVQGAPPATRTITITNRGSVPLFLNQATVTPGFTVTGPAASTVLQPGSQVTVEVTVDASSAGSRPGVLSIPSNDLDEPVFTVPLRAEVVNPVQTNVLKIRTVNNRKTGLHEQTIRVTNADTNVTVPGYRVFIAGLPPGVVVRNASGMLEDGRYYIDVLQPLGPLGSFDLVIEYFFPLRRSAKVSPYLSTEVIFVPAAPVAAAAAAAEPDAPFVIDRIERMSDGSFLLEFRSVPGRLYQVEYSTDNQVWKTAVPTRAAGSRVQWIDRAAGESDKGFYRVRELEN